MKMEPNIGSAQMTTINILVVDDMEANRAVLCRRLERFGYGVVSVDSGPAALAQLLQSIPDIILLDYMMPQMSGIEVLQRLRRNPATRSVPVIMVTARAENEATIEALEAGADDYVTKPIDFDVLKARIDAHLSKRIDASDLRRANAALDERVTVRSLALADIEEELKAEIQRRKALERQLEILTAERTSDGVSNGSPNQLLEKIAARFDTIFAAVASGRTPNLAQMAELKTLVAQARSHPLD